MSTAKQASSQQVNPARRTQIARAIFTAAESMGMSDRQLIERLTSQVIERLEQPQPLLPGMEHLVPGSHRQQRRLPTDLEIQAIVKELTQNFFVLIAS